MLPWRRMNSTSSLDQAAGAFGGALRSSERARAARARHRLVAGIVAAGHAEGAAPAPHQARTETPPELHRLGAFGTYRAQQVAAENRRRAAAALARRPAEQAVGEAADFHGAFQFVDQPVAGDHQRAGVGRAEQQVVDGSDRGRGVCSHGTILADTGPAGLAISLRAASLRRGGRRRVRFPWFGRSSGGGRLPVAPPWEWAGGRAHGRAPR